MFSPEQIEQLRMMTSTSGWGVLKACEAERGNGFLKEMLRLPSQRSTEYKEMDDATATAHLKGRIYEIEWLLSVIESEIKVHDVNRRYEELKRQEDGVGAPENPVAP